MQSKTTNNANPFNTKKTSEIYDVVDRVYYLSAEAATDFINPQNYPDDCKYIDIGAGTGISSEVMLSKGAQDVILVEPSEAMLDIAQKKLGKRARYLQSDVAEMFMSFNKDIDVAFALNCFHLFPDLSKALAGVACTLKEEGVFVFNLSAPTYGFAEITAEEKKLLQGNVDFYSKLAEVSAHPILLRTVELLQKNIAGEHDDLYTEDKLAHIFAAFQLMFKAKKEITFEVESNYQRNIWQMMARSFVSNESLIQKLIDSVDLPPNMLVRQVLFAFSNANA